MSAVIPPKHHPFVMLVEGRDDVFAIANLLKRHEISWPETSWYPLIKPFDGVDALLEAIPVSLKTRMDRLAIVIDADLDTAGRWAAIRARFAQAGVDLPAVPSAGGTVVARSSAWPLSVAPARVGVWVMPNNLDVGGLEGFLKELVPAGDT